ncbi:MAG: hypothetical protein QOG98_3722, partial [Pseudonocardiales bacterium]|nr:hypothetical protein [Pseudonocardiales bacterium]
LDVKGTQHSIAAELEFDLRRLRLGGRELILTSSWVLDASWITKQRVPALSPRVVMRCSVALAHCA